MRTDYLKKGKRDDTKGYSEFPFSACAPIVILGVLKATGEIIAIDVQAIDKVQDAANRIRAACVPGSERVLGVWPGKVRSDVFDLNVSHYTGGIFPAPQKKATKKKARKKPTVKKKD